LHCLVCRLLLCRLLEWLQRRWLHTLLRSGLTSVTIGNSVTSIGESAFAGCTGMTSVVFAENSQLRNLGHFAFGGCVGLEQIGLPKSVMIISYAAFGYCENLTSVTIASSNENWFRFDSGESIDVSDPETNAANLIWEESEWIYGICREGYEEYL